MYPFPVAIERAANKRGNSLLGNRNAGRRLKLHGSRAGDSVDLVEQTRHPFTARPRAAAPRRWLLGASHPAAGGGLRRRHLSPLPPLAAHRRASSPACRSARAGSPPWTTPSSTAPSPTRPSASARGASACWSATARRSRRGAATWARGSTSAETRAASRRHRQDRRFFARPGRPHPRPPRQAGVPLSVEVERDEALDFFTRLKQTVDRAAVPARLDLDDGRLVPGVEGYQLHVYDCLAATELALAAASARFAWPYRHAGGRQRAAEGPRHRPRARAPSPPSTASPTRTPIARYNLKVGASKLDATVIEPGGRFSFNETVGPRTEAQGYRTAPVITEGELVDGMAGGACQLSSTLFSAAFFAGLELESSRPHTRPSAYIKMGLDAAVAYPGTDLVLKNPYPFPVVIHFKVSQGKVAGAHPRQGAPLEESRLRARGQRDHPLQDRGAPGQAHPARPSLREPGGRARLPHRATAAASSRPGVDAGQGGEARGPLPVDHAVSSSRAPVPKTRPGSRRPSRSPSARSPRISAWHSDLPKSDVAPPASSTRTRTRAPGRSPAGRRAARPAGSCRSGRARMPRSSTASTSTSRTCPRCAAAKAASFAWPAWRSRRARSAPDLGRNLVRPAGRRRAGPRREGKHMEVRERRALDQGQRRARVRLALAGEAGDEVGAEREIGAAGPQLGEQRAQLVGADRGGSSPPAPRRRRSGRAGAGAGRAPARPRAAPAARRRPRAARPSSAAAAARAPRSAGSEPASVAGGSRSRP